MKLNSVPSEREGEANFEELGIMHGSCLRMCYAQAHAGKVTLTWGSRSSDSDTPSAYQESQHSVKKQPGCSDQIGL